MIDNTEQRLMNRRQFLWGMGAIALAGPRGIISLASYLGEQYDPKYELIKKFAIDKFNLDYVRSIAGDPHVRGQIEKSEGRTFEEKIESYARGGAENDVLILDGVVGGGPDFKKIAWEIARNMKKSEKHVGYEKPKVLDAIEKQSRLSGGFFSTLHGYDGTVTAQDPQNFRAMVRGTYTMKTLEDYIKAQKDATDALYDAMYHTISPFFRWVAKGEIGKNGFITRKTKETYEGLAKWLD